VDEATKKNALTFLDRVKCEGYQEALALVQVVAAIQRLAPPKKARGKKTPDG
jgi:hypothetical protein